MYFMRSAHPEISMLSQRSHFWPRQNKKPDQTLCLTGRLISEKKHHELIERPQLQGYSSGCLAKVKQQFLMNELIKSPISLIHISSALVALLTGTWVVLTPKGTVRHQRVGYLYIASMMVVLTTAFGIYRLFGRFGIVHWGAVFDWLALAGGIGVVWFRAYVRNWLLWHYMGMSLSVMGLYTTFIVEATYRLFPPSYFWWTTVGTSMVVFGVGAWLIYRHLGHLRQQPVRRWPDGARRRPLATDAYRPDRANWIGLKAIPGPEPK
jgi:uncharacterized membrane protein